MTWKSIRRCFKHPELHLLSLTPMSQKWIVWYASGFSKNSPPLATDHMHAVRRCTQPFYMTPAAGPKTAIGKLVISFVMGNGENWESWSLSKPWHFAALPAPPETPTGKWPPCWDMELPPQSDARPLSMLGKLTGPLEDHAVCAEAGTEAILKIRRGEVITEYEMSFSEQGLTVCFCQLGLGSPQANSLQRTVWKVVLASAWEMGFAEWFIFTREEITRCLQSPMDQALGKGLCTHLQGNVLLCGLSSLFLLPWSMTNPP